jgi:taurine dioxygenase
MNDTTVERVRIRPLPAPLGASVDGVDLSTPLDSETFRQIEDAYDRHSVLVFRDQKLTPQQHIAFGRLFGPLEIHVVKKALLTDFPEILLISNVKNEAGEDIGLADAGQTWHTDTSYRQRPSRGSILYALEIPHDEAGRPLGNTKFASTAKAYEDLPVDIKERLAGRKAIHSYAFRKRPEGSQRHKITA